MSTITNNIPAVIIPANINEPIRVVMIAKDLAPMYDLIGCDLVERVALNKSYNAALWVDEEGLCKGKTINLRASCLLGSPLVGDAIMAGDNGSEIVPLLLDCPKMFFDFLQQEAEKVKKMIENGTIPA